MAAGTAIAAIGGSLISGMMSKDASDEVSDASRASVAEQRRQFNQLRRDIEPYRETGTNALYGMTNMLGLGGQEYYETQADLRDRRQTLAETDRYKREFVGVGDFEPVQVGHGGQILQEGVTGGASQKGGPSQKGGTQFRYRNEKTGELLTPDEYADRLGQGEQERVENPEYLQLEEEIGQLEQELQGLDPQAQGAEGSGFDISETPGYQFRMDQGVNALNRSLAATGNRLSGRAVKAATRYGQGLASQEFSNRFNRLASLSGRGQAAVETSGQAGMQAAGQIGNSLMAGGRARAAGIAGKNQAIQGGIGNYLSYQQNQNMLNNIGTYTGGNNRGTSYGTGTGSSPVAAYGR